MRMWSNNKRGGRLARENEWNHDVVAFSPDWLTWHEFFKQPDWIFIRREVLKPIRKNDKTYGHLPWNKLKWEKYLEPGDVGMKNMSSFQRKLPDQKECNIQRSTVKGIQRTTQQLVDKIYN